MNTHSEEDLKNDPRLDGNSVDLITSNLDHVVYSVNEFMIALMSCYTVGNVAHDSFRYLRNIVTTDSLYFLTNIVPYLKSALISCKEFFEIIADIELNDFYECRQDIKGLGDIAANEFSNMLDISKRTQGLFFHRTVQAKTLLTALNIEQKKLENEIEKLSQKIKDLDSVRLVHFLPLIGLLISYKDDKDISKCDNQINGDKESLSIINQAMEIIQVELLTAIQEFHKAIVGLTTHFSSLNTKSRMFLQQCERDPAGMSTMKSKELFFDKIVKNAQSISNKICQIIEALDVMHGDMLGLDEFKSTMNYIPLEKTIFKSEAELSLELAITKEGYADRIAHFLKKEKKKFVEAIKVINKEEKI